jgi:hypothetical protein
MDAIGLPLKDIENHISNIVNEQAELEGWGTGYKVDIAGPTIVTQDGLLRYDVTIETDSPNCCA